jgi:hypothetical protein
MAFTTLTAGDRLLKETNVRPKIPKSGYTPAVGDLVTMTGSGEAQDGVDLAAAAEALYGLVYSLNSWDSSNTTRPISVFVFESGTAVTLPYTGTVNIGDKVEFNNNTHDSILDRTVINADNGNGDTRSKVAAVDAGTQFGTGYAVVEFL